MNSPNPALVTQRAAKQLPRVPLLLLCAAYLVPGLLGRDPWKSADLSAFGYMLSIAQGRSGWFTPTVGGLAADAALLPYWLGASFIKLLGPWVEPDIAARVPFALLLVLVLVWTWYSTYHLARTEAAQPLAFAFGGEANPVDYARAIADGAVLALIASLGLLQLGHETTPELSQLASVALFVYALAACPFRTGPSRLALLIALPALAASGAPSMGLALGVVGAAICLRSGYEPARRFVPWVIAALLLAVAVATLLGGWHWRVGAGPLSATAVLDLLRLLAWFTWPGWALAVWTVWRWRGHVSDRHISIPLGCTVISLAASITMGGSDRALLLGLPPLAVLAAFALPTLRRSTSAAIDWFSVFFFSAAAGIVWVVYVSMQTGVPAQPAINIARLASGYTPRFSSFALLLAALGTLAWMWLVKWRTGRGQHPLWKSLVLPASGVALFWLLVMTLMLPPLDHARSYHALVKRIALRVPVDACIAAPGMPVAQVAALEYHGRYRVDAVTAVAQTPCDYLLLNETPRQPARVGAQWRLVARERRDSSGQDLTAIYRRAVPSR